MERDDNENLDTTEVPVDEVGDQGEHDHEEVEVPEWDGTDESTVEDENEG